jgi:membrane protease YdiL (CAAX protease family)
MLVVFAGLLAVSVIFGCVAGGIASSHRDDRDDVGALALRLTVFEEVADSVLVVVALAWVPVRFRHPSATFLRRIVVWTAFLLVVAGLVALNARYHKYLRDTIHVVPWEEELLAQRDRLPAWFLLICVQPAIIEELFFRYLALGVLRSVVKVHAAVWISAAMFTLAHIGVPLSMPVLLLVGVGLGYARVASGHMLLPMFLHFMHNAVFLSIQLGWIAVL